MKAMLEPSIVAACTQGPAFQEQGVSVLMDLMNPSSQGCFSGMLVGASSTRKEVPVLATGHLPALRKKTGGEPGQRVPKPESILAGARRAKLPSQTPLFGLPEQFVVMIAPGLEIVVVVVHGDLLQVVQVSFVCQEYGQGNGQGHRTKERSLPPTLGEVTSGTKV